MAMADEGDKGEAQPPGLDPRPRRSAATGDMAGGEEGAEQEGGPGPGPAYVLSLPAAWLPLPVAVACLDATVRRKPRSRPRLRAQPEGWWAFKLPVVVPSPEEAKRPGPGPPAPASAAVNNPSPRPQRLRVHQAPEPYTSAAAAAEERPAKRVRMCLQCGAEVTPQWRSGPMGQGTLCNACGVRLKAAGALRGQAQHRRPAPAAAARTTTPARPPPPDSPVSDSSPDSRIWEPGSVPDVYLVRKKPPKRGKPPPPRPRTEPRPPPPPPRPAAAPAVYLVKKKKKKKASAKKPWRPAKSSAKQCTHCGSTSTPQWREGPLGRSTLCNACGVRYRQGRLLPEYRPAASPTFEPSAHASRHSQVLQLHRERKRQGPSHLHHHQQQQHPPLPVEKHPLRAMDVLQFPPPERWHVKEEYPPTPLHQPLPHPVVDGSLAGAELRVGSCKVDAAADADAGAGHGGNGGGGKGSDLNNAPASSLDSLLLEGPSAPLLVDGEPLIN